MSNLLASEPKIIMFKISYNKNTDAPDGLVRHTGFTHTTHRGNKFQNTAPIYFDNRITSLSLASTAKLASAVKLVVPKYVLPKWGSSLLLMVLRLAPYMPPREKNRQQCPPVAQDNTLQRMNSQKVLL